MKLAHKLMMAAAMQGGGSNNPPSVTTGGADTITDTTARLYGSIDDIGSDNVTAFGHCWSTSSYPDINDDKTDFGGASGPRNIISDITGLDPDTVYHYRAYAQNPHGVAYGSDEIFTTEEATGPDRWHIQTFCYTGDGVSGRQFDFPGINMSTSGKGIIFVRKLTGSTGTTWMALASVGTSVVFNISALARFSSGTVLFQTLADGYCRLTNDIGVNASGEQYSLIVMNCTDDNGVKYADNDFRPDQSGYTYPHNLGAVPDWLFVDSDHNDNNVMSYVPFLGPTMAVILNSWLAAATSPIWNNTAPTSTTFTYTEDDFDLGYAAFAKKSGVCDTGKYTGTGSQMTLTFGFKPKMVILRPTSIDGEWFWMSEAMEALDWYHHGTTSNPAGPANNVNFTDSGILILNSGLYQYGVDYFYFAIG